jgi:uncharacterized membrane protein
MRFFRANSFRKVKCHWAGLTVIALTIVSPTVGYAQSFQIIPDLPDRSGTYAAAVSSNGNVLVGWGGTLPSKQEAIYWTATKGTVALGFFPPPQDSSQSFGANVDGSVIVGSGGTRRR